MSSAAFSIVFSLDREQPPKPSSDSPLSNLAIMSTPLGPSLEKEEEVETIPPVQQVEDSGFCMNLL
jgi:hypothetical protein